MRLFNEDSAKDAKFPIVPEGISEVYVKGWNDAIDAIVNNAPTVERPHGKWIIDGHHIRCNRCNEYTCDTDREGDKIPNNFCPNCGADMREADNV